MAGDVRLEKALAGNALVENVLAENALWYDDTKCIVSGSRF